VPACALIPQTFMTLTRRDFLAKGALSSASIALGAKGSAQTAAPMHDHAAHDHPKPVKPAVPRLPAILLRTTGTVGTDAAYEMLKQGDDTLDAALKITTTQEDDANDFSAGLGGLPDEEGVVQLDACCMHGPSRGCAAVSGVVGIRNVSLLARAVLRKTGYASLAGEGAQRFAATQGFSAEDLTTERTRKIWALWKQIQAVPRPLTAGEGYDPNWPGPSRQAHFLPASQQDLDLLVHRLEPLAKQAELEPQWTWRATYDALFPAATPLCVLAANEKKEVSCAATTSGLPWRMAGACSDIGMIGAGCFLDPEVGSACASGNAEANIKIAGAHLIVQSMRNGRSPQEAGMEALRRIAEWYGHDMTALRFVEIVYFILRKDGAYSSVSLWRGDRTGHVQQFTIHDGVRRTEECVFLFDGNPPNGLSRG
jgi:N4-(beta-N-acetylglucosaminyl)-L-asparaginase